MRRNYFSPSSYRAPCRVVSVGNICAGGTGKTPFTIALAKELHARGIKAGVSHRGYKGKFERIPTIISHGEGPVFEAGSCGDEAYLLGASLPGIPVVAGADRTTAIKLLLAAYKNLDVVIMDDGLQHLKVHRDLDIVCFSAQIGTGNGRVLPAGILREPLKTIKPWYMLVVNHKYPGSENEALTNDIRVYSHDIHHLAFEVTGWKGADGASLEPDDSTPCSLISAIADPVSFENLALSTGVNIVKHFAFTDHYPFIDRNTVNRVLHGCRKHNIERLLCTSKDMTKLKDIPDFREMLVSMEIGLIPQAGDGFWDTVAKRIARAGVSG